MNATEVFQTDAWKKRRPSFTLVELLVVVAIIGILIGMVMYTLAGAQRDALNARTQGTIRKLNDIILQRWEEYRYRAVKINIPQDFLEPYAVGSTQQMQLPISPREGARVRMMILRDTMRMEFPDRYSDIVYSPSLYKVAVYTADNAPPISDTSNDELLVPDRDVPGIYNNFRRKMVSTGALGGTYVAAGVFEEGAPIPTITNQSAELLYQIVASSNYNGSNGLEFFRPSEIGDTDGDGFPEFLDGWRRPIRWLRWPAGYGFVDPSLATTAEAVSLRPPDSQLNDPSVPDALDPLHTDWRWPQAKFSQKPWLLVPLIVSAGADGMFDIQFDISTAGGMNYATNQWPGPTDSPAHMTGSPYYFVDPYWGFYDNVSGAGFQGGLGQWFDEDGTKATAGAADNLTNYGLILE